MLVGSQVRRVAIVGGSRIPFARAHGAYARVGNQEMLTAALRAVVGRFGLRGEVLGDVIAGAVMKHSSQWNLARECVLGSGLAPETPGLKQRPHACCPRRQQFQVPFHRNSGRNSRRELKAWIGSGSGSPQLRQLGTDRLIAGKFNGVKPCREKVERME